MSGAIFPVTMPKWGIEMQEGTITDWHAAVGQHVSKTTPLLDVETDKIVNTVESPVDGTLRRILAETGETLAVGALLAIYADASVSEAQIDSFVAAFKPADASFEPAEAAPAAPAAPAQPPAAAAVRTTDAEVHVSPIAKRLAEKLGIDLSTLTGTGPNGRISKEDVEAAAARLTPATTSGEPRSTRSKLSAMRLAIARRLVDSKQSIPHYRLEITVATGALAERRRSLVAAGTKVSVNDLIVRACGLALAAHPALNAHCVDDEVINFADADVCIAVATEQGLLTPVVRAVQTKSVQDIASATADLAVRARAGTLRREEITGGTFTVSNLGMYGLDRFDAIINPPQVAILAVGAVRDAVVVRGGAPVVAPVVTLTLSCDHRVVDGAMGAKFLSTLKQLLEEATAL